MPDVYKRQTYISDISDSAMSIPDEVAVRSARKHLIVFGRSLYRDGLNRRYESAFLWVCLLYTSRCV